MTADRTIVAQYTYNAWGEILSATGSMASINPLRYRGYYYDSETAFYYLQSRYYDPANHRFINADSYASTGQGFVGTNMFAYCLNNPVNGSDPCGTCYHSSDPAVNCHQCIGRPIDPDDFSPIDGQALCDYADVTFGWGTLANNGCAVIAIYNALGLIGMKKDISYIIDYLGNSWNGRLLGVTPGEIGDALTHFGVSYKEANSSNQLSTMLSGGGMAIVTRWNVMIQHFTAVIGYGAVPTYKTPSYLDGAHTVLIVHDGNGLYTVYNRYSNSSETHTYSSFEAYMGSEESYIAGFYIG